ncbi:hypothetical protein E4V51_30710, partial [Paenibacillus sp. 28ISP30-2]|nr:hypothetical protein [Paenibacillus sp. 28ISP30-2]
TVKTPGTGISKVNPSEQIKQRVLQNIAQSKAAREASKFGEYVKKEKLTLDAIKKRQALEGTQKPTQAKANFTSEEISNLQKHVIDEAQMLKDSGLTNKQLGPAVAGAYDNTTGKFYTAINDVDGFVPKELHPIIEARIKNMPKDVYESYSQFTHGAGSHAEVYAANKALLANPNAS